MKIGHYFERSGAYEVTIKNMRKKILPISLKLIFLPQQNCAHVLWALLPQQ